MDAGTAQLMIDVPADQLERLRERMNVRAVGGLRVFLLGLSCKPDSTNPVADLRVRRAATLAIDRRALTAQSGGYAQIVDEIASPEELGGRHVSVGPRLYDPVKARNLLREAGHPAGFDVDLDLSAKYLNMSPLIDELGKELSAVGIRVRPQMLPTEDYFKHIEQADMRMFLLGWVSDTGDGRVSYEYLLHTRTGLFGLDNATAYSSLEMDHLIELASQTTSSDQLDAVFEKLERKVFEDIPLIPLCRQEDLYAFAPDLVYTPRLDRRLRVGDARWR
jgi:peptide/nickel transport system substrate-binding protein